MMMNLLGRFFRRLFRSMVYPYAPGVLTLAFAIVFVRFFPDGPIWPIGIFAIIMVYIVARYAKW